MHKSLNKVLLALATVFVAQSSMAALVTAAPASVTWSATAVKKSDVVLNVFKTGLANLSFAWNPATSSFGTATSGVNIQIGKMTDATSYNVTAQLVSSGLTNTAFPGTSLTVGATMGTLRMLSGDVPKNILSKTGALTASVIPSFAGDLSVAGPLVTAANASVGSTGGTYYSLNQNIVFDIPSAIVNNLAAANFSTVPDTIYSGDVTLSIAANWVTPGP